MHPSIVNNFKTAEVVYLPEVKDKELNAKFGALGARIDSLKGTGESAVNAPTENWWKRNGVWFFPALTLTLGSGCIVGFFMWFFGDLVDHRIDAKVKEPAKLLSEHQASLARIEGRLDQISGLLTIIVQNEMKRVASLSPGDFDQSLPDVKTVLSVAKSEHVTLPSSTIANINSRLRSQASRDRPGFWGAATAMINYRSGKGLGHLPSCLADKPVMTVVSATPGPGRTETTIEHSAAVYENCEMELDTPKAQAIYLETLRVADLELRHCRVLYHGGILLFPPQAVGTIVFVECVFELSAPSAPPSSVQALVLTLLSAPDLEHVSWKVSS